MEQNRKDLNQMVANYEQLTRIRFSKTNLRKLRRRHIKRFLYEKRGTVNIFAPPGQNGMQQLHTR